MLLAKQIWKIIENDESLWVKWIHVYRLKGRNFWDVGMVHDAPWFWRKAVGFRDMFRDSIVHELGNGMSTSLWVDTWHPVGPLCHFISKREIYMAGMHTNMKVGDIVSDGLLWRFGANMGICYSSLCLF